MSKAARPEERAPRCPAQSAQVRVVGTNGRHGRGWLAPRVRSALRFPTSAPSIARQGTPVQLACRACVEMPVGCAPWLKKAGGRIYTDGRRALAPATPCHPVASAHLHDGDDLTGRPGLEPGRPGVAPPGAAGPAKGAPALPGVGPGLELQHIHLHHSSCSFSRLQSISPHDTCDTDPCMSICSPSGGGIHTNRPICTVSLEPPGSSGADCSTCSSLPAPPSTRPSARAPPAHLPALRAAPLCNESWSKPCTSPGAHLPAQRRRRRWARRASGCPLHLPCMRLTAQLCVTLLMRSTPCGAGR